MPAQGGTGVERLARGAPSVPRSAAAHGSSGNWESNYYQAFFALLTLLARDTDNAAIGVEQLDDIDLGLVISETFGLPSPPILSAPSGR